MWLFIAKVILRYRSVFIWLILIATYFMIQQGQTVKLSYAMANLLPKNSKSQLDYDLFVEKFGIRDNVMVIGVKSKVIDNLSTFRSWCKLQENIQNVRGVISAYSVVDAINLKKDKTEKQFAVQPIFDNIQTQTQLNTAAQQLDQLPFYDNTLYSDSTSIMLVELDNAYITSDKRIRLIERITELGNIFNSENDNTILYSGLPYIRTINSQLIRNEVGLFIFLALIVTAIILFYFFRTFSAMLISMLVVTIGVIFSFGTLGVLNYDITILSALIPPLLIVIGVPNCIFLINKYHNEFKKHGNKSKSLVQMIRRVGNITILTNTTTALGFATFIITSSKDLRQFGLVASLNIFAVFIISLLIIPIILSYLNPPKEKHTSHLDRKWLNSLLDKFTYIVLKKRNHIYIVTSIIIASGVYGLLQMRVAGNITDDMPHDSELYQNIKFFETHYNSVLPLEIMIDTHRKNGITKLSTLRRIDQFNDSIKLYPEFSRSLSVVDPIKFSKQALYNGNKDFYDLPNSQEKRWLMDYTLKSETDDWINAFVDKNRQFGRISLNITDIGTNKMNEIKEKLQKQAEAIFDSNTYDVFITGTSVVFLKGTSYLVKNLFVSLFLAILLISFFMAWMFNSFRMVMVSLIPNLIPLIVTASIMGFLEYQSNHLPY